MLFPLYLHEYLLFDVLVVLFSFVLFSFNFNLFHFFMFSLSLSLSSFVVVFVYFLKIIKATSSSSQQLLFFTLLFALFLKFFFFTMSTMCMCVGECVLMCLFMCFSLCNCGLFTERGNMILGEPFAEGRRRERARHCLTDKLKFKNKKYTQKK